MVISIRPPACGGLPGLPSSRRPHRLRVDDVNIDRIPPLLLIEIGIRESIPGKHKCEITIPASLDEVDIQTSPMGPSAADDHNDGKKSINLFPKLTF